MIKIMFIPGPHKFSMYITKEIEFKDGFVDFDSQDSGHIHIPMEQIKHIKSFNVVNEDKLNELATTYGQEFVDKGLKPKRGFFMEDFMSEGYEAGYRKALENE